MARFTDVQICKYIVKTPYKTVIIQLYDTQKSQRVLANEKQGSVGLQICAA